MMTRAEIVAWLQSLPKQVAFQQAQVYSKRLPGWGVDDLLRAAGK